MEFCEKCERLMLSAGDGIIACSLCGEISSGELSSTQAIKYKNKGVEVIPEISPMAGYNNVCKKCKFGKAEIILREPAISDEDHIVMLKCGKCGLVENLTRKMF